MGIVETQARMGFKTAGQRPSCCNCKNVEKAPQTGAYNDRWPFRCNKGGFGVSAQAICDEHERRAN